MNVPPDNAIFYFDGLGNLNSASITVLSASHAETASWAANMGGANGSGSMTNVTYLSSSVTWSVPMGTDMTRIIVVGGGGGRNVAQNQGGGGGGYCESFMSLKGYSSILATVGTAGSSGKTGSKSTFLGMTANGGGCFDVSPGAYGGTATGGTINLTGIDAAGVQAGESLYLGFGKGGVPGQSDGKHGGIIIYF